MGMFDTFKYVTECPNCGREKEFNFQTKELVMNLNCWSVGDEVEFLESSDIKLQVVGNNQISCRAICSEYDGGCGKRIKGDAIVEDGVFKKIENLSF